MVRPGLEPRTPRRPCKHSDYWATEPHGRSMTISPCLIRFVSESVRNHTGTNDTVPLLLAARVRTHTEPQMSQERKKHTARPGLEPRTSRIPCEHSDYWTTEPHGRPVTISSCLIRFVPESGRNHAGTDETVPLLLAARARTHTEPTNVKGEEKAHDPTGTRTQDPSQTVRALWLLSYCVTRSTCDISPLLNKIRPRIWSEPCRNRRDSPFAARSPSTDPHWPPNVTGEEKHMARPGLEPRTPRRPCEHFHQWATEPQGRPVAILVLFDLWKSKSYTGFALSFSHSVTLSFRNLSD